MQLRADDFDLETLLQPVEPHFFLEHYWEKESLHLSKRNPGFYDPIFTLEDVDRWIATARQGSATGLMVKASDKPGVIRSGKPSAIPLEALYEDISAGHSLILRDIQESWAPFLNLTASLEESLSARVQVNLYLSPAGSKVFPRHIDYHDFFIFQIYGAKDWYLYDFDYLPMERLEYGPHLRPFTEGTSRDSALRQQLRLEQGDLLYVPRGMPHHAAAADSPSLHLTVSFHPLYWMDLLKAAVEEVCVRDARLQKSLPPGFLRDPALAGSIHESFGNALAALQEASFETTFEALSEKWIRTSRPYADGHFSQILRAQEVHTDTVLERRTGMLCRVEPAGEQVAIRFGAGEVRGPASLQPVLEFIRDHRRFRVGDLPGMSDNSRLTLARRLIRSGLLRTAS